MGKDIVITKGDINLIFNSIKQDGIFHGLTNTFDFIDLEDNTYNVTLNQVYMLLTYEFIDAISRQALENMQKVLRVE